MITELTDSDSYCEIIKNSAKPKLVFFFTGGCSVCEVVKQVVSELSGEFEGNIEFFSLNLDKIPAIRTLLDIRTAPAITLHKENKLADVFIGAVNKDYLRAGLMKILT